MAKKVAGAKERMAVGQGFGGANPTGSVANVDGWDSYQAARNNSKGDAPKGKVSGAKERQDTNCTFGGTYHEGSVVDTSMFPGGGKDIGGLTSMGATPMQPKGEYADRMHVAGGFGGAKQGKGVNG